MKKKNDTRIVATLLWLSISTFIVGCADNTPDTIQENKIVVTSPTVTDILDEKTASSASIPLDSTEDVDLDAPSDESSDEDFSEKELKMPDTEGIDVDLTALSATAVYGEVYNMMYYPEKYVGKIIRMQGIYSDYFDQSSGKQYYACIIMDATACCAQGIEFILTDEYNYPDDYPNDGDTIVVEGVFDTYEEESGMYCTLRNAYLLNH